LDRIFTLFVSVIFRVAEIQSALDLFVLLLQQEDSFA
jgi:hypothetical protein